MTGRDDSDRLRAALQRHAENQPTRDLGEGAFSRAAAIRRGRRLGAGVAVVALLGGGFALGQLLPHETPAPPATATPTPTSAPTSTASRSASGTSTPLPPPSTSLPPAPQASASASHSASASASTPPAATACAPAGTRLTLVPDNAGAGHVYYRLMVTNTANSACTLAGFAGVSMVTASGAQIGAPAQRDATGWTPMRLARGASATAWLDVAQAANVAGCSQTPAAGVRVYLPGRRDSAIAVGQLTGCSQTSIVLMTIKPFG